MGGVRRIEVGRGGMVKKCGVLDGMVRNEVEWKGGLMEGV